MKEKDRIRLQLQEHDTIAGLPDGEGVYIEQIESDRDYDHVTLPVIAQAAIDPDIVVDLMETIEEKTIRWLWPGHIPFGALTLIIGDPGLGKSQLTLDLAARTSSGVAWPDGATNRLGNVILLASEDSLDRTITPRLRASGAYLNRIVNLREIRDRSGKTRMFNLKTDLDHLERLVVATHADMIVIDPLNGYLGDTNSWKESEVRNVLAPACAMADRHDVAIIGVVHLNKDNTRAAIHRVLGSVAFSAVTRSMFAVAQHPTFPSVRYFVSVKQNYAPHPQSMKFYMVEGGGLDWDPNPVLDVTADNLLAVTGAPEEKAERKNAKQWLAATLEGGPMRTAFLVKLARDASISDKALHRAKYDLRVTSVRVAQPGTLGGGYWMWKLP